MRAHSRSTSTIARRLPASLLVVSALVLALLPALPAQAVTTIAKINFQPTTFTTPSGYTADNGLAYSATRGFGWIDQSDSNPLDMTANMRSGNSIPPAYAKVSDMMMQPKGLASGRWEYAIANGTYNVALTVGDARMSSGTNYCCIDGTMRLTVEGVEIVKDYVATPAAPLFTTNANVTVSDGKLTVDAVGGINTKLDHIEITSSTGTGQTTTPTITGATPANGTTGVALNTSVSLALSEPVLLSSVTPAHMMLTGPGGAVVAGNYNADAAGGTASFTPSANLAVNTLYTLKVTGLVAASGPTFGTFTSSFTTGSAPPPLASTAFAVASTTAVPKPNVLTIGPDGKLYVGTVSGRIYRFTRGTNGALSNGEYITPFGNRVVNGLAFDPVNPTKLWITSGYAGYDNAPPMSGHLSTIIVQSGQPFSADTASATDVIVGFPRSMHDHMTNGIAFGPDGKLYIAQGANTSYGGAPDPYWGARGEAPLTASILVADVDNTSVFPSGSQLDVNTDPVGFTEATGSDAPVGYNPKAANAPLKVYAYGTRNPYTLMWDSNGSLYAPVNESAAGGVTPAGPNNVPVSVKNIQAYTDYFTKVVAGKYYGHPNATQGYYALNGGNPTAGVDPYEVTEYPVGTQPDANWKAPDFAMGVHRSPDGAAEYTNGTAFSGALKGKILVSEYSDGDDLLAMSLDGTGKVVSEAALPDANNPGQSLIFDNPLGVAVDGASGVVYVAEHGDETMSATGQISVLDPATTSAPPATSAHVNFQPSSVPVPTGYTADTGAAFNGTSGWEDLSGAPLDLTANTRVAHAAASPDARYDTDLLMQAPSGSGTTTPGQWATVLPNGTYDVSVTVGDPLATNSVDEIVAQPGTASSVTVIDHFAPTSASPWSTSTKRVTVSNGLLVLSPTGGTNTKIDFVDAVPSTTDTLSPTVTLTLGGTLSSGTTYTGPVTVTASAVDNVGVTSTAYVLDSASSMAYTAPVVVSGTGTHTITVTAKDAAGNPGVATKTFTIAAGTTTLPSLHVNFAAQTSAAVAGYTTDYGAAFTTASGTGWEDQTTGAPVSAIGNGRERGSKLSPDKRYDTFMQMQETAASTTGTHTPVRWEHKIANGTYAVTVGVGDATNTNSVIKITAEPGTASSTVIINNFQATTSMLFQTMTKNVTITDGFLTLSGVGGTNGKIDYVDAVPVTAVDVTAPSAAIALAGPLVSGTTYSDAVTATVTASDNPGGSGVASVTYSLDSGPATPYPSTGVVVSSPGVHQFAVTVTDFSDNVTTISSSFSIVPGDTTAPTATINLAGPLVSGSLYSGAVTATVTADDNPGGSGVASVTYSLDGSSAVAVPDAGVTISSDGLHILSVTVNDVAGNTVNTIDTFTIDTTAPTGSIALTGDGSGSSFTGDVTATLSDADTGGSGVATSSYVLDGAATPVTYSSPIVVTDTGDHTLVMTVTDNAGNSTSFETDFTNAPAPVDANPPSASLDIDGTRALDGTYIGDVTLTATGIDNGSSGISTTYVLDGSAPIPYSTAVVVSTAGHHKMTVTVTDGLGGHDSAVQTWDSELVDKTPPDAAIILSGSLYTGTTYGGDVTASAQVTDLESGVSSVSYELDGSADTPYTAPILVTGDGLHTLQVTATNNQSGSVTVTKTWTQEDPDTTKPTASVTVTGNLVGTSYVGGVTAHLTATDADSGVAAATYVLDSNPEADMTDTVSVPGAGAHTLTLTVTDNAGNVDTSTLSWFSSSTDGVPPTISVGLAGTLYSGTTYTGDVLVTMTAADNPGGSGLAPTTYVLDGTTATYDGPFTVTALGSHTLSATATDNQNNAATADAAWTQVVKDVTKPTASVTLSGSKTGATYVGSVTASMAAADEAGGSGIASATYVLDSGTPKAVVPSVTVSTAGTHTLTVTAVDNAGNTTTATQTWTSQLVDTVHPTVSVSLSGALYSGTRYGGNVQVTITAADNVGGSGLAQTTYVLDGTPATYTGPFTVNTTGNHTLTATATDNQNNATSAAAVSWSQQTPDTVKPVAAATLGGTVGVGGIYIGTVTATITSSDEAGGSGLKSTTYSLDGGGATPYTTPVSVTAAGAHTIVVTVTDNAGNVGTASTGWNQVSAGGTAKLVVTSPDDATLANPSTPRLVFSAVRSFGATPAKAFTFTNNGTGTLIVSNIAIAGTNANSWKLDVGQLTTLTIPGGGTAQVSLLFTPTDPIGCSSTASPYAIGDVDRNATLTFSTNDATQATGSALLSGVNSCYVGGNNEPVLDQLLPELGYTDVVDSPGGDHRYIGALRYLAGTDEIQSPYFTVANAAQPVSVIPIAHYGSASASAYQATGYYAQGSAMVLPKSSCSSACKTLWQFPADTIANGVTTYNQNQKLLPGVTGATTFTGTGTFGFFSGDFSDVNFSDDSLNIGHDKSNNPLPVPHYTHGMRVFPAYGPGHVVIPNTYIIAIDLSRVPAYKNNDYQDIVLLVRNVQPALTQGPLPGAATTATLTNPGGTVSATCQVTGFDGVLANTTGNACNPAAIAFTAGGLRLTSTAGQLANLNQQNALYKTFDATHNQFTVDARVVGPLSQIATDFQQVGVFFGPDTKNFVKAEVDSEGSTQHLTMFYSENGVTSTVAAVALPAVQTATTIDLIITGNGDLPDPLPFGDTYGVHGFPLDQLSIKYSLNGATPVAVGTVKAPADVTGWFSRQAKAGILVSNSGTAMPIAVTFSKFSITAP